MKPLSTNSKTSNGKLLWILDNGHGVETPGKRSPMLMDGRQFREYLFNREVVNKMISMLGESGYQTHQLVPEEEDIPLSERVARANALNQTNICVLVAVHSNAYGDGRMIADVFQENLVQLIGWLDR